MRMNKIYDNSQVTTYQKCPFSYYLQYVLGLKKNVLDDSNSSMHFGSAVHEFLESFYSKKKFNINEYEEPEGMPQYSRESLKFVCDTYISKFEEKDSNLDIKECEKVSECDLGGYKFIVKKDGVFEQNGNVFGLEHKTTKSISYNYFDKFFNNSQISAQCYTTQQDYGQCSGILLNAIEVKLLKRKPTAKGYDGWREVEDGFVTCRINREYINRTPDEVEQWKNNTTGWIGLIEKNKEDNKWLRSDGLWGGIICSSCTYKELCKVSVGIELDESIADLMYDKVDPYEYLREDGK